LYRFNRVGKLPSDFKPGPWLAASNVWVTNKECVRETVELLAGYY